MGSPYLEAKLLKEFEIRADVDLARWGKVMRAGDRLSGGVGG